MRWTALLSLLVAACSWPAEPSNSQPEVPPPTVNHFVPATADDHRAWLDLYDEAGFLDVSALQRVRIETGRSSSTNAGEPTIDYESAWLVSTSPLVLFRDSLRVLHAEGAGEVPAQMLAASPDVPAAEAEPPCEPLSFEEVDFADELRIELDAVEALTKEDGDEHLTASELGPRAMYWLVRARWAEMRGHPELTRRALAQVERWTIVDCGDDRCATEDVVRTSFQAKLMRQAVDGIRTFMPRPRVREIVVRALAMATSSERAVEASELLARLDRTIATDANGPPGPEGGKLERAEHLVFLLRDHNDHQPGQFRSCGLYAVLEATRKPMVELVALGRDVIPVLIEHIDDDTLTRSIPYDRYSHSSARVSSVGDLVLDIIERLAGRVFDVEQTIDSNISRQDQARLVKQQVRDWWATTQGLTEREQLLRDLHETPEPERDRIAGHLLMRYGMAIWPELTRAFGETKDPAVRVELLHTMNWASDTMPSSHANKDPVGPVSDRSVERVEGFLIAALDDPSARVRRAAAWGLSERGRRDGRDTMIRDLDRYWLDPAAWGDRNAYESYFGLLAADGSAPAVDAIRRAIPRRGHGALKALRGGGCRWARECDIKLDPAAKVRLLDTVADYLDDFGGPEGVFQLGPVRTRDEAAAAYAALTGRGEHPSGREQTSIERDRKILVMLDEQRSERDLEPVSWPHVAPPTGTPGRDHVQRGHVLHTAAHETDAHDWLAGFANRDLDLHEVSTALIHFAQRHPDVPVTLRIHRFPGDVGVVLTLEVGGGAGAEPEPLDSIDTSATCVGADCGGMFFDGFPESDEEVFMDALVEFDVAWSREPTRIEEYIFQVKVPSFVSRVLAAMKRLPWDVEDINWDRLLSIAGFGALGLALIRVLWVRRTRSV